MARTDIFIGRGRVRSLFNSGIEGVFLYARPNYYINLYSPTSGSKKMNIQTYKYGEKATKEKTKKKNSEQVIDNYKL